MRDERYIRNKILSDSEQELLCKSSIAVFGCGGLGGYVIEELARMGIHKIYAIDFDVFSISNLNRQIMCTENDVGKLKAEVVKDRIKKVNSNVEIVPIINSDIKTESLDVYKEIIENVNVVIDALDTIKNKVELERLCEAQNKILIHGAICGWVGQVSTIYPNDKILNNFYKGKDDIEDKLGNPSFTPAVVASIQVSEVIKVLIGKHENTLSKKMLMIDLENNDFSMIEV